MLLLFDLQMFADAAAQGTASMGTEGAHTDAAAGISGGAEIAASESTEVGKKAEVSSGQETERIPFEQIRQLYKDDIEQEYARRHNRDAVRMRKNSETLGDLKPLISRLANQYGKDAKDIKGIVESALSDNAYYEQRAMKNGTTPELERQLDESNRAREAAQDALAAREEQDRLRQQYQRIEKQLDEVQKYYPDFDLDREMKNPLFESLCQNPNVSLRAAYQAAHFDEIISRTMQNAVHTAEGKIANRVKSGSGKPTENGAQSGAPADVHVDPSKMSPKQIRDIIERVKRGEIVTF